MVTRGSGYAENTPSPESGDRSPKIEDEHRFIYQDKKSNKAMASTVENGTLGEVVNTIGVRIRPNGSWDFSIDCVGKVGSELFYLVTCFMANNLTSRKSRLVSARSRPRTC